MNLVECQIPLQIWHTSSHPVVLTLASAERSEDFHNGYQNMFQVAGPAVVIKHYEHNYQWRNIWLLANPEWADISFFKPLLQNNHRHKSTVWETAELSVNKKLLAQTLRLSMEFTAVVCCAYFNLYAQSISRASKTWLKFFPNCILKCHD